MNTMFRNSQNSTSLMSQFNKFVSDFKKSGQDPNAVLNQLLSSGKVSKDQLERAKLLAGLFSGQLK
jgi:DNA-binding transcriptional regulator YbjK